MASLAAEHKPTVLGIPGQVPIPYQLECTVVLLQSLHALFQLPPGKIMVTCLWCRQNSIPDLPPRLAGSYHSPQDCSRAQRESSWSGNHQVANCF